MKLRQSEHLILLSKTGQQMARGVELEDMTIQWML